MTKSITPSTIDSAIEGGTNLPSHRRALTAACAVLGPGLIAAGVLLHPAEVDDHVRQFDIIAGQSGVWATSHLLVWVGAVLLIPAVLGIMAVLDLRRPALATAGGLLVMAGCVSLASLTVVEQILGEMAVGGGDREQMVALAERFDQSAALNATAQLPGLALVVGILVLVIGLWRSKLAPRPTCIALLAGIAAASAVGTPVWKLGWVLVFAAFAALAGPIIRGGRPTWAIPDRQPARP